MTDAQKTAMKAGRVRAAEARKAAAKSTVGMAAGHERDEQRRVNKDALEEQIDKNAEAFEMEAVDKSKLDKRDRETIARIEDAGDDVENRQPGYRYARITVPEGYGHSARANIRQMKALAEANGYEPVHGEMPEDERYRGNDHAAGGTLRGLADTVLWRIREEDYQKMIAKNAEKARRQGAIEEQGVIYARSRGVGTMHGAAGDFSLQDPLLAHIAGEAGQVERFTHQRPPAMGAKPKTNFTEGDLRRGSLRGPGGQVMQPGFETRVGR